MTRARNEVEFGPRKKESGRKIAAIERLHNNQNGKRNRRDDEGADVQREECQGIGFLSPKRESPAEKRRAP